MIMKKKIKMNIFIFRKGLIFMKIQNSTVNNGGTWILDMLITKNIHYLPACFFVYSFSCLFVCYVCSLRFYDYDSLRTRSLFQMDLEYFYSVYRLKTS